MVDDDDDDDHVNLKKKKSHSISMTGPFQANFLRIELAGIMRHRSAEAKHVYAWTRCFLHKVGGGVL